jgi:hypothetical protein
VASKSDRELFTLRGIEQGEISLEDYANFHRDLVFIHDRIWILALRREANYTLYYSRWFYVRDQPRVPKDQVLQLRSSRIGSPFNLSLDVNVGEWFEGAANAFLAVIRGLITLPEYRDRKRLENRRLRATVINAENEQRARSTVLEVQKQRALRELRNLPGLAKGDIENRLRLLENDINRISESPLQITDVNAEDEKEK